jgi:predicted transposase/invertase (TIGR01784 family)
MPSKYLDLPQKIARGNKAVADAFEIVSRHNWTKLELEIYEKELDDMRCMQSALETAEEKGIEKGKAEGKQEGKIEEKKESARNLLANGISINIICKSTGLKPEEVEALALSGKLP